MHRVNSQSELSARPRVDSWSSVQRVHSWSWRAESTLYLASTSMANDDSDDDDEDDDNDEKEGRASKTTRSRCSNMTLAERLGRQAEASALHKQS